MDPLLSDDEDEQLREALKAEWGLVEPPEWLPRSHPRSPERIGEW